MAGVSFSDEANATRLYRILIGKGTEALRKTFDMCRDPTSLPQFLKTNRFLFEKLKDKSIINKDELNRLNSESRKDFDFRLLSVLLQYTCKHLKFPATGWDVLPDETDRSREANLVRIKLYTQRITHLPRFAVSASMFEDLWPEISKVLLELGVSENEIGELHNSPFSNKPPLSKKSPGKV
jgi:hypothetical protein